MDIKIEKPEKLIKAMIHSIQGMSFGNAQKLIRLGKIKVNGKKVKDNISLASGDIISIYNFEKTKPELPIIYEDDNIIIVNKPYGIECATRDKSSENTYSIEELLSDKNAIVVHRLDRLTSGLLILAKSKKVATLFEKYFRNNMIEKSYTAGVFGIMHNTDGIQKAYLKKDGNNSLVTISDTKKDGYKEILTEIHIRKNLKDYTILDITLHTGKTHQIRAHLSHLGYPIVGDNKYGKKDTPFPMYKGYMLTSTKLKFKVDGEMSYLNDKTFEVPAAWLELLENINN